MTDTMCWICNQVSAKEYGQRNEHAALLIPPKQVVEDHYIVVSLAHVRDALVNPVMTAQVFRYAAICASSLSMNSCNLVTAVGMAGGDTFSHLHVHIIPRAPGDHLHLPSQRRQEEPQT